MEWLDLLVVFNEVIFYLGVSEGLMVNVVLKFVVLFVLIVIFGIERLIWI